MNKKEKKNLKGFLSVCLFYFFLNLSVMLIMGGLILNGIGSHNVDLGQNVRFLNAKFNLSLVDMNNKFEIWDATTMYITGINQQDTALWMCMLGSFLFGIVYLQFFIMKKGG